MKTEQGEIPALFSCREAWGLARRLRRGRRACSPMGRSIVSGGDPKVSKGERREASIQWIQPPKAVSDPEFRQTTSGTHGSAGRADCLPRGKPFGAPAGAYLCPRWGLTRRLRRGRRACSPKGRSIATGGDPKGVQGGERKATLLASWATTLPQEIPSWRELTRRLRRG